MWILVLQHVAKHPSCFMSYQLSGVYDQLLGDRLKPLQTSLAQTEHDRSFNRGNQHERKTTGIKVRYAALTEQVGKAIAPCRITS